MGLETAGFTSFIQLYIYYLNQYILDYLHLQ